MAIQEGWKAEWDARYKKAGPRKLRFSQASTTLDMLSAQTGVAAQPKAECEKENAFLLAQLEKYRLNEKAKQVEMEQSRASEQHPNVKQRELEHEQRHRDRQLAQLRS